MDKKDPENIKYADDILKILVTTLVVAKENRGTKVDDMQRIYDWYNKIFEEDKDGKKGK